MDNDTGINVDEFGKTIPESPVDAIIRALALSETLAPCSMTELWAMFYVELRDYNRNPKALTSPDDQHQPVYRYDAGIGRKTISLTDFANKVSRYRMVDGLVVHGTRNEAGHQTL